MGLVLSELNIYPVKSAAGIALERSQAQLRGLEFDRRWMITDPSGKFMTQRQYPRMALINVQIKAGELHLSMGMESIAVPPADNLPVTVEVWGDFCKAVPAAARVNHWLSKFLDTPCQLVYMPEDSIRPVDRNYAVDPNRDRVSFADGFPYLLISQASLEDLNSRLEAPILMNRFRPNFVVSGCEAFAEDRWNKIRIGSVVFHLVKLCSRCAVTTVNQATGIRGQEPLATLGQYRRQKGKILFGQNLVPENEGSIVLGDAIEILA